MTYPPGGGKSLLAIFCLKIFLGLGASEAHFKKFASEGC